MKNGKKTKTDWVSNILLYTAPIVSVAVYALLRRKNGIDVFSDFVLALLLAGVYFTFLHVNNNYFYQKIVHKLLYFGSLFLSLAFLGLRTEYFVGVFWMTAIVIAALDAGIELALATHCVLMIEYTLLLLPQDDGFYRFTGYILLGIVIALLLSLLKGSDAVPYLALILAACDGILQFVVYRFNLAQMRTAAVEIVMEIVSVLVFALIGAVYLHFCGNGQEAAVQTEEAATEDKQSEAKEETAVETDKAVTEEKKSEAKEETAVETDKAVAEDKQSEAKEETAVETDKAVAEDKQSEAKEETAVETDKASAADADGSKGLSELTAEDFELLVRLESYSHSLLLHSKRIGQLSEQAATAIGGDAMLARAGGLYHEIGRMEDENDYIEAGTRIGKEYGFPENLLAVMRQHSTGFEFPKSVEAAVVMLSDCIVSTSEYLEKHGKRNLISDERLVNNVFQNRLEKGNLELAGMTKEQVERLREFYVKNTFMEG